MATLDSHERIAVHGSMQLSTKFIKRKLHGKESNLKTPAMSELCELLKNELNFEHKRDSGNLILTLTDIQITQDNKYACILVNIVNKRGGTTVIRDFAENTRSEVSLKSKHQGYETSTHILFSLEQNRLGMYDFIYDYIPHMNLNLIESFFNKCFESLSKKNQDRFTTDTNFKPVKENTLKKDRCNFKVINTISATPDQEFLADLKDGIISDVKLIKYDANTFKLIDRDEIITPKRYILEIESKKEKSNCVNWLRDIAASTLGDEYTKIRFSFKATEGNRSATLGIKEIRMSGLEKSLVKKTLLKDFGVPLKDSYTSITSDIMNKLIELGI